MAGIKHGFSEFLVYQVWINMHDRCYNPRNDYYCRYGGRGVKVCARWHDFYLFLKDMGHPPPGMTIGRKDNDGDYEPGNCRWEVDEQQNDNTSRTVYIAWQGRTQTINGWSQELDLDPAVVWHRQRVGWETERMLTTPTKRGFEEGRELRKAKAKKSWAKNGRRYKRNSVARLRQDKPAKPRKPRRKGGRLTAEEKALILELRAQGLTGAEIASRVGVCRNSVVNVTTGRR